MIYTSYYSNLKKIIGKYPNLVFISIAGYKPAWLNNSIIEVLEYKKLAPKKSWWKIWHDKFQNDLESEESKKWYEKEYYETVLNYLDPQKTRNELMKMSKNYNICLLCYETPNKFCHRQLVAKWFNEVGIECKEIIV